MKVADLRLMEVLLCIGEAPWGLRDLRKGWMYRVVMAFHAGTRAQGRRIRMPGDRRGAKFLWRDKWRGSAKPARPRLRRVKVPYEGRLYSGQLLEGWGEPVLLVLRRLPEAGRLGRPAKDAVLVVGERQLLGHVLMRTA